MGWVGGQAGACRPGSADSNHCCGRTLRGFRELDAKEASAVREKHNVRALESLPCRDDLARALECPADTHGDKRASGYDADWRWRSIRLRAIAFACSAASGSPSAAAMTEPFIRMCQERAKSSVSRNPASSAS
jgi:hypothetical protein